MNEVAQKPRQEAGLDMLGERLANAVKAAPGVTMIDARGIYHSALAGALSGQGGHWDPEKAVRNATQSTILSVAMWASVMKHVA